MFNVFFHSPPPSPSQWSRTGIQIVFEEGGGLGGGGRWEEWGEGGKGERGRGEGGKGKGGGL